MSGIVKAPFYIAQFSLECFSVLVRECFGEAFPEVSEKNQVQYLCDYLHELGVKTIVCETDYVDRGYLEDFSSYYVTCFGNYPSRCARFHFFSTKFSHSDFQALLDGVTDESSSATDLRFLTPSDPRTGAQLKEALERGLTPIPFTPKRLQQSYKGFAVVKPLPKTFIGRTCLSPYASFSGSSRKKVLTRKCYVNLFGMPLTVESVAFQEQDKVISACVTSALWSLMHALTEVTRRRIPSPSEITISAKPDGHALTNSFPISGLDEVEIVRALDHFRLKHHGFDLEKGTKQDLLDWLDVYLNSGHPLLLGGKIFLPRGDEKYTYEGDHAVAVLGLKRCEKTGSINQIYVHDDRWGPYLSATISEDSSTLKLLSECADSSAVLAKDRGDASSEAQPWTYFLRLGKTKKEDWYSDIQDLMVPTTLIVPTYRKVRVSARPVLETTNILNGLVRYYFEQLAEDEGSLEALPEIIERIESVEWEVRLRRSNRVKDALRLDPGVLNKREILLTHMPRYVWAATARDTDGLLFTILFDATDIPQGKAFVACALYKPRNENVILRVLEFAEKKLVDEFDDNDAPNFLKPLIAGIRREESPLWKDLDERFGELRAPDYIKSGEVRDGDVSKTTTSNEYFSKISIENDQDTWLDVLESRSQDQGEMKVIWAISAYGSLLIGEDSEEAGHPTLTGAQSARIAGEIKYCPHSKKFLLNARSGRYSSKYSPTDRARFLESAVAKFEEIFADKEFSAQID